MRVVGYIRVSTDDQADRGASLPAQKTAIAGECDRRGWQLVDLATDTASAGSMRRRPGLARALEQLDQGQYEGLLVARMDRAFRSVGDFAVTMSRADRHGWALRMLDPDVDMTTPYGRALAGVSAVFAQLERELISQRTRDGIAQKKRDGTYQGGRLLPQAQPVPGHVADRIVALSKREGLSSRQIAARLDLEGVPTLRGGPWRHTTVLAVLRRRAAA